MEELDRARYISLTTFKKDGTPVSCPVWVTGTGGSYELTTGERAWKARRLLRNPSVRVQVCDMRGRVKPGATPYVGTAEVMTSPEAVSRVERALLAKYGWQFKTTRFVDGLRTRLGRNTGQEVVAIRLSLEEG